MSYRPLALAAALAALLVACDTATDEGRTGLDARYALVKAGDQPVPLVFEYRPKPDEMTVCVDTLFEQAIALEPQGDVTWDTRSSTNCNDGRDPVLNNQRFEGAYRLRRQVELDMTLRDAAQPSFSWTITAIMQGDSLTLPITVYTEEDPFGTELTWVYRRVQ